MAAGHGGKRAGAGRKPKAEKYERPINRAEKQIVDRLPEIVQAQIDLALGVTVHEVDDDSGGVNIYQKPPDHKAGAYLIDRILGKPTTKVEAGSEDGGPLRIIVEYGDEDDPAGETA